MKFIKNSRRRTALQKFLQEQPRGEMTKMAAHIEVSKSWLSLVAHEKRIPSPMLAIAISAYTKGKVSRKDLRPDIFN
jgi:DNA-binding transcriptional regulator YdaS (Cro superfamily)